MWAWQTRKSWGGTGPQCPPPPGSYAYVYGPILKWGISVVIIAYAWDTQLYALAMITTLMPHLRIGPYKEGVTIDQIQMRFHVVGHSFSYELLILYIYSFSTALWCIAKVRLAAYWSEVTHCLHNREETQ